MEMTLQNIDLRPWACLFDTYVMVKDGNSSSSNVLRVLCEADTASRRIASSGNKMIVERYGELGSSGNTGFEARYEAKPLNSGGLCNFSLQRLI